MCSSLLRDLACFMDCDYISDLKYMKGEDRGCLLRIMRSIPRYAYTEEDWAAAAQYLHLPAN